MRKRDIFVLVLVIISLFSCLIFRLESDYKEIKSSQEYKSTEEMVIALESYGIDVSNGPAGSLPQILDLLEVCYGK